MQIKQTDFNSVLSQLYALAQQNQDPGSTKIIQNVLSNLKPWYENTSGIYQTTAQATPYFNALDVIKKLNPSAPISTDPNGHKVDQNLKWTGPGTVGTGSEQGDILQQPLISTNPTTSGSSPEQDRAKVEAEGQRQQKQLMDQALSADALRKQRRDELAKALTTQADTLFSQGIPGIAEDANAAHIYTGTGFSDALAREKAKLSSNVLNQLAVTGTADTETLANAQTEALKNALGFQSSGLSREFSLEDWTKQASLAKELGALAAPQVGDGKGSVGAGMQGAGSLLQGLSSASSLGGKAGASSSIPIGMV